MEAVDLSGIWAAITMILQASYHIYNADVNTLALFHLELWPADTCQKPVWLKPFFTIHFFIV